MNKILLVISFILLLNNNAYGQDYEFPVSDKILYQIWNSRVDLQDYFPEVESGNYDRLQSWAKNGGWKTDPRLASLVPEDGYTTYMKNTSQEKSLMIYLIPIGISISIVIGLLVSSFPKNK